MKPSKIYLTSLKNRLAKSKKKVPLDKEEIVFIEQLIIHEMRRLKNVP